MKYIKLMGTCTVLHCRTERFAVAQSRDPVWPLFDWQEVNNPACSLWSNLRWSHWMQAVWPAVWVSSWWQMQGDHPSANYSVYFVIEGQLMNYFVWPVQDQLFHLPIGISCRLSVLGPHSSLRPNPSSHSVPSSLWVWRRPWPAAVGGRAPGVSCDRWDLQLACSWHWLRSNSCWENYIKQTVEKWFKSQSI